MFLTIQGQLYAADIVLDCTGIVPETSLTRQAFGKHDLRKLQFFTWKRNTSYTLIENCLSFLFWLDPSKFDNKNRLKVTPELLIVGETNVYAIGDCCNTSEEKLAAHACAHARTVAYNIWRDIKGKAKKPYTQSKYFYEYCHDRCVISYFRNVLALC